MANKHHNSTEVAYNFALARLLRHEGLNAQAEQRQQFGESRGQADVLLDFDDYSVVIEAEFGAPAKADADKRFPPDKPATVGGLQLRLAVAVGYPERLADLPESDAYSNLEAAKDLKFSYRYYNGNGGGAVGSVANLAEQLRSYWVQSDNGARIGEIVEVASTAIDKVAEVLDRIDRDRGLEPAESPGTKALIWLNALVFQELLARHLDMSLLPPEHQGKTISRPDPAGSAADLQRQWEEILAINWWPIFDVAREALRTTPGSPATRQAIVDLIRAASDIVESGMIRRHDVAGRVFHRLLDSRKFLATNYTTIPAAIMLAGLAFDERGPRWSEIDFASVESVAKLRIVDPACGSGTLLMAAAQEVLKRARLAGAPAKNAPSIVRTILEEALYGFDVVPAAIHLAASTLCMAEARQVVSDMNLWRVRHDVSNGIARLGSLDFLRTSPSQGNALTLGLFEEKPSSRRVTGSGELEDSTVAIPSKCHLVIANPPYTRAGGPGDKENTEWNPIFGSMLDKGDAEKMKKALRKTLTGTAASLYAGLGSAFIVLANDALDIGGRLAFVLPATMITGSRWAAIRSFILSKYAVEWVVVSHDSRNRSAKKKLPGRRMVSFSESTRIAEVLIVATRRHSADRKANRVCFVNLLRNPDEPIDALGLTRKLLVLRDDLGPLEPRTIEIGNTTWGNAVLVPQGALPLDGGPWPHATFVQPGLALIAMRVAAGTHDGLGSVSIAKLGKLARFGPYEMQVKNPKQGLFTIRERPTEVTDREWKLRTGFPALWRHKAVRNTSLAASSDALLERRPDRSRSDQDRMLAHQGRLQIARMLGMAPQRVAAVITDAPMLGVSSWISVIVRNPRPGKTAALCLWLNSTLGLLLRIMHGNRPYLGRSGLPHELARTMPVLDVDSLQDGQLKAAAALYADIKHRELQGFSALETDPVRRELNERLCREVLDIDPKIVTDITKKLALEPTLHARH